MERDASMGDEAALEGLGLAYDMTAWFGRVRSATFSMPR